MKGEDLPDAFVGNSLRRKRLMSWWPWKQSSVLDLHESTCLGHWLEPKSKMVHHSTCWHAPRGTGVFIRSTVPAKRSAKFIQDQQQVVCLDHHQVLDVGWNVGRTRQRGFATRKRGFASNNEIWPTTRKSWEVWTWCFPSWKHWKIAPRSSIFVQSEVLSEMVQLFSEEFAIYSEQHGTVSSMAMQVYQRVLFLRGEPIHFL